MVWRIGSGTGVRTAEIQAQVPKAWLHPLLSLTYILCGSLVYKCPSVWSATFVMGSQYNLNIAFRTDYFSEESQRYPSNYLETLEGSRFSGRDLWHLLKVGV